MIYVILLALTSLEIVVGSLQKNLAISLNVVPLFSSFWIKIRSSSVRCF